MKRIPGISIQGSSPSFLNPGPMPGVYLPVLQYRVDLILLTVDLIVIDGQHYPMGIEQFDRKISDIDTIMSRGFWAGPAYTPIQGVWPGNIGVGAYSTG